MSIKINYSNKVSNKSSTNIVLFTDEKFNINSLKIHLSSLELSYIVDLLKTCDLQKSLLAFDVSSKKKIILISIKKNLESSDVENLGAEFFSYINNRNKGEFTINADSIKEKPGKDFIGRFLHGLKLKSYEFNIYKSKK